MEEQDRLFCVSLNHYNVRPTMDESLSLVIHIQTGLNTLTDRQAQLVRDTYPGYTVRFYEHEDDSTESFAVGHLK